MYQVTLTIEPIVPGLIRQTSKEEWKRSNVYGCLDSAIG